MNANPHGASRAVAITWSTEARSTRVSVVPDDVEGSGVELAGGELAGGDEADPLCVCCAEDEHAVLNASRSEPTTTSPVEPFMPQPLLVAGLIATGAPPVCRDR
jgi:hypothetical protein